MSNNSVLRQIRVSFLLASLLVKHHFTLCLSNEMSYPDTRHLRYRLLEKAAVPSSAPADIIFTQSPSSAPYEDREYDGSVAAEDTIPAVIIGVASSVILCAMFLFFTDLKDRFRHERLLDEREQRRQQQQQQRETESSSKQERTLQGDMTSSNRSPMPVANDQPEYVEKASESSVSTMTSVGGLRAAVLEDADDSLQVTALTNTHHVSRETFISSLVVNKTCVSIPFPEQKRIDSADCKSLEGGCKTSPIIFMMEDVNGENGGGENSCRKTHFDVSENSVGLRHEDFNSPEATRGRSMGSLHDGSQHSTSEMSMASSIKSVESSSDEVFLECEPIEAHPLFLHKSTKITKSSRSLSPSGNTTKHNRPRSPAGSVKSLPNLSCTPPMPSTETTSRSPCSSVQLVREKPVLHSLQSSSDSLSIASAKDLYHQRNEEVRPEKRDIPVQAHSGGVHGKQSNLGEEDSDARDYIRNVYFVAVTNTSNLDLGLTLEGAADEETFPIVHGVQDSSPLLDRIFVGDQILAVNNALANGLCADEVTELCLQEGLEEDSEEDSHVANVVKFTVMSSQADGSESCSSSEDESSAASVRSETESEV